MKRSTSTGGFTLFELLVVITILGIIAYLTVPALLTVTAKARSAKCLANLSQLHIATMNYAADNSGLLPDMANAVWVGDIWPYLNSTPYVPIYGNDLPLRDTVFACPEATQAENPVPQRSYGMNGHLVDNNPNTRVRLTQLVNPAETVLLADNIRSSSLAASQLAARHAERCNAVFIDGHVESMELTTAITNDFSYRSLFWRGVTLP